jgi:signal peptidase
MKLLKILVGTLIGTAFVALLVRLRPGKDIPRSGLAEDLDRSDPRDGTDTLSSVTDRDHAPVIETRAVKNEEEGVAPARSRRTVIARLARSNLAVVFAILVVVGWFLTLRPVAWGGPAGYNIVSGVSMQPTLNSGDLVLSTAQQAYSVGDIITYPVPAGDPAAGAIVVHRIVGGDAQTGFITKGDNNSAADPWHPTAQDVIGRVWVYAPGVGRLFLSLRSPFVLALTLGAFVGVWWFLSSGPPEKKKPAEPHGRRFRCPSLRRQAAPASE